MKQNTLKALAVASALIAPFSAAQAEESYVGAQLAIADVDGMDNGLALALSYGQALPNVHRNFSVEGEFTTTISDPDDTYTIAGVTYRADLSYYTLAAYGVYNHPLNPKLDLYGRVGLLYESVDVSVRDSLGGSASGSDDDLGISLGAGIDYSFSPQMDLTAGVTIIESDINHISAGIKYKL